MDGPTASSLARAFREFDAVDDVDESTSPYSRVPRDVLRRADLKGVSEGRRHPVVADLAVDGPDGGPTRMLLTKPIIAAVEGYAVFGVYCRR